MVITGFNFIAICRNNEVISFSAVNPEAKTHPGKGSKVFGYASKKDLHADIVSKGYKWSANALQEYKFSELQVAENKQKEV